MNRAAENVNPREWGATDCRVSQGASSPNHLLGVPCVGARRPRNEWGEG